MPPQSSPPRGLCLVGTDTNVGKTYVGSALVRALRTLGHPCGAYKPVASGCVFGYDGTPVWPDTEAYFAALGGTVPRERITPQAFCAPVAPPVAARTEGRRVDPQQILDGWAWWHAQQIPIVVEGVGGLLSPLTDAGNPILADTADLARLCGLPVLVIARLGLGTLNHTLLTLESAGRRGLDVVGIVLSQTPACTDSSISSNPAELSARTHVPLLATLPAAADADLSHHPRLMRMLESL